MNLGVVRSALTRKDRLENKGVEAIGRSMTRDGWAVMLRPMSVEKSERASGQSSRSRLAFLYCSSRPIVHRCRVLGQLVVVTFEHEEVALVPFSSVL